jgi:hypothetical protein
MTLMLTASFVTVTVAALLVTSASGTGDAQEVGALAAAPALHPRRWRKTVG